MRLLPRRRSGASLSLSPTAGLRPTETVTATVTLDEAVDGVTAARVELGYVNAYRYYWAGRRDAAVKHDDSSLLTMGQVGTSYGSTRETSDWVHVLDVPLTVVGGALSGGTHTAALRLPSWAPGSAESAVRWEARLRVERAGRDVEAEKSFQVLVGPPDPAPAELPLVQGESALANTVTFGLAIDGVCHRVGDPVRGVVSLTPRELVTRTANLDVRFLRLRISHPLEKTPSDPSEHFTRPHVVVAEDLRLTQGVTTEVPFEVVFPVGEDPTTETVHCTLEWWLMATLNFAGATGGIERARRGIVVYTA